MSDRVFDGNVGGIGFQNLSFNGYGDTVGMNVRNGNDVIRGYINGYMYFFENFKNVQFSGNGNRGNDVGVFRVMEFLQIVINISENVDNRVINLDKEVVAVFVLESKSSRVFRLVSVVRIQKVQYNVIFFFFLTRKQYRYFQGFRVWRKRKVEEMVVFKKWRLILNYYKFLLILFQAINRKFGKLFRLSLQLVQ